MRRENRSFMSLFRIKRETLKRDLFLFLGLVLLCGPLVFLPDYLLSQWLWGNREIPFSLMFQQQPLALVYTLLIMFPVTIAFAELASYFGYIMPRLVNSFKRRWIATALPIIFLSLQHCTLPFIADPKFLLYRGIVFLPFATLIGTALRFRPQLLPMFAILHGILDAGTVMLLLKVSAA